MSDPNPNLDNQPVKKFNIKSLLIPVLIVAIIGCAWYVYQTHSTNQQLVQDNKALNAKIDSLQKQLSQAKTSPTPTPSPSPSTTPASIPQSLKDNIKAAITTMNTAALEGYMASSVNVVFAASEKGGFVSPAQAVSDLSYLSSATSPWDFNLSAATLTAFQSGDYQQYLASGMYIGQSANNYVVSFGFNTSNKINLIFVSPSADLLK